MKEREKKAQIGSPTIRVQMKVWKKIKRGQKW